MKTIDDFSKLIADARERLANTGDAKLASLLADGTDVVAMIENLATAAAHPGLKVNVVDSSVLAKEFEGTSYEPIGPSISCKTARGELFLALGYHAKDDYLTGLTFKVSGSDGGRIGFTNGWDVDGTFQNFAMEIASMQNEIDEITDFEPLEATSDVEPREDLIIPTPEPRLFFRLREIFCGRGQHETRS